MMMKIGMVSCLCNSQLNYEQRNMHMYLECLCTISLDWDCHLQKEGHQDTVWPPGLRLCTRSKDRTVPDRESIHFVQGN